MLLLCRQKHTTSAILDDFGQMVNQACKLLNLQTKKSPGV